MHGIGRKKKANNLQYYYFLLQWILSDNGIRRLMKTWDCSDFIYSFSSFIHMAFSLSDTSLMRQCDHTSLRLQAAIKRFLIFKKKIISSFNTFFFFFFEKLSKKEAISSAHSLACKLPAVRMGIDMLLRYLDRLLERGAIRALSRCDSNQSRDTR